MADEMCSPRDPGVLIFAGFTSATDTNSVARAGGKNLNSRSPVVTAGGTGNREDIEERLNSSVKEKRGA